MQLTDTRAIVTGGVSGLGLAVAQHLVANGGKVALFDVNEEKGAAAVAELGESNARFFRTDVTDEAGVAAAADGDLSPSGSIVVRILRNRNRSPLRTNRPRWAGRLHALSLPSRTAMRCRRRSRRENHHVVRSSRPPVGCRHRRRQSSRRRDGGCWRHRRYFRRRLRACWRRDSIPCG